MTKLSSRYAKSLLGLAIEQGQLDRAFSDMKMVSHVCNRNNDLVLLLKSPVINTDKKLSVLNEIFGNKIGKLSLAFINIITRKRRENYLDGIAKEFISQYKSHKNIVTAVVTSVVGLDDKIRSEIMRIVKKSANAEVELVEKTDNDLIGGIILKVGDKQIDASIRHKLNNLKKEFN